MKISRSHALATALFVTLPAHAAAPSHSEIHARDNGRHVITMDQASSHKSAGDEGRLAILKMKAVCNDVTPNIQTFGFAKPSDATPESIYNAVIVSDKVAAQINCGDSTFHLSNSGNDVSQGGTNTFVKTGGNSSYGYHLRYGGVDPSSFDGIGAKANALNMTWIDSTHQPQVTDLGAGLAPGLNAKNFTWSLSGDANQTTTINHNQAHTTPAEGDFSLTFHKDRTSSNPPTEPTPTQPENPFPNANIDPAAIDKITGTSTVEPGADIGDVTRLHNVTVGTTAQIGDGAQVSNSTIAGTVAAGATVKNATVRNGAMVGANARVTGSDTAPLNIAGTVPAGAHVTQSVPAGTVHGHTANAEIPTTPGLPSVPGLPGVHYSDMPGNGTRAYLGTGNSLVPGHVAINDREGNLVAWNTTAQPSHLFAPGLTLMDSDGRQATHSIEGWLSAANSPQSCPGLSPSNNNDEAQIAANWERVLKAACGRDSASVGPPGESLTINADPDHLKNLLTGSMTSSRLVGDHVARCRYEGLPGEGKSLEWTATHVPPAATLTLKQDGRVLDRAEFTVPQ